MLRFDKEFANWVLSFDSRVQIAKVSSKGTTLRDLIENAEVILKDWTGQEFGYNWTLGDLDPIDHDKIVSMFADALLRHRMKYLGLTVVKDENGETVK